MASINNLDDRHTHTPGEDVILKYGDVVVDCEVNGGLQCHGLQRGMDGMELLQRLAE